MSLLVRVLSAAEAADDYCCENGCDRDPSFAVSTPTGARVVCDDHLEGVLAALPPGYEARVERERAVAACEDIVA